MHYLYDDAWITYPQLVKAAQKAESEQEDHTGGKHICEISSGGREG